MENKRNKGGFGVTFSGSVTFHGPMFDIHDNEHVHIEAEKVPHEIALDEYVEYEEMSSYAGKKRKEEPNYFQTGRFLKRVIAEAWFEELRTDKRFTTGWREKLVDALTESKWKDTVAEMWEDKDKRETLKGFFVGALKDAGVIDSSYDALAQAMGYEENYRTFSKYMSRAKKQAFHEWIMEYVNGEKA